MQYFPANYYGSSYYNPGTVTYTVSDSYPAGVYDAAVVVSDLHFQLPVAWSSYVSSYPSTISVYFVTSSGDVPIQTNVTYSSGMVVSAENVNVSSVITGVKIVAKYSSYQGTHSIQSPSNSYGYVAINCFSTWSWSFALDDTPVYKGVLESILAVLGQISGSVIQGFQDVLSSSATVSATLDKIFNDMSKGFADIIAAIQSSASGSASTPEQDAAASEFKGEMEEKREVLDDAAAAIESGAPKPEPSSVLPPKPGEFVDMEDSGVVAMGQSLTVVLGDSYVLQVLLMAVSLGVLSYILYGRRG